MIVADLQRSGSSGQGVDAEDPLTVCTLAPDRAEVLVDVAEAVDVHGVREADLGAAIVVDPEEQQDRLQVGLDPDRELHCARRGWATRVGHANLLLSAHRRRVPGTSRGYPGNRETTASILWPCRCHRFPGSPRG